MKFVRQDSIAQAGEGEIIFHKSVKQLPGQISIVIASVAGVIAIQGKPLPVHGLKQPTGGEIPGGMLAKKTGHNPDSQWFTGVLRRRGKRFAPLRVSG